MDNRVMYAGHDGRFALHLTENDRGNISLLWHYEGDPPEREHEIVLHNSDGHAVVASDMQHEKTLSGTDKGRKLKRFWFSR